MFVTVYRGRTRDFTVTVFDPNDDQVTFRTEDVMRLKVGRVGGAPILDFDSNAATSNGSSVADANPCNVRLAQGDLNLLEPGIYTIEVGIVDDSDADKFKHAQTGILSLVDTMLGDTGLA